MIEDKPIKIIPKPIGRYILGKRGFDPLGVVFHTMDGPTGLDGNLQNHFDSDDSLGATHLSVGANGTIYAYVDFDYMVAANSNRDANQKLISIEFWDNGYPEDSKRTGEMYRQGARLVAYLARRYNWHYPLRRKHEIWLHRDFNPAKSCPGGLDWKLIMDMANELLAPKEVASEANENDKIEVSLQKLQEVSNEITEIINLLEK